MLNVTGIDHINLNVKNLKSSINYYQELFNEGEIKEKGISSTGNPYAIFGVKEKLYLCLYQNPDQAKQEDCTLNHIGINVSNFQDAYDSFMKKKTHLLYGGMIEHENSRSFYIQDPDGNEIEISEVFAGGLK